MWGGARRVRGYRFKKFLSIKKKIVTKEKSFPEWGYYKTDYRKVVMLCQINTYKILKRGLSTGWFVLIAHFHYLSS